MNKFAQCIVGLSAAIVSAQQWTDVSTTQINALGGPGAQGSTTGCSGTVVNRLTGDVFVHIVGFGIWKSTNKGSTWTRVDQNTIDGAPGGRCENGWGVQIDQDNPVRMAVFTLDGQAGYTVDGTTWKQWKHLDWGRNWDYGSVDWSSPGAKTIIGVEHEKTGNVVAMSTNGGTSWTELTTFTTYGGSAAMVGVIDSTTLIASKGTGILRSTDLGATWNTVSSSNPLTHVPLRFKGKFYLPSTTGLLVSADKGITWTQQGVPISGQFMVQGPFFGADENTFVVGVNSTNAYNTGTSSIYKTTDAGAHWTKISDVPASSTGWNFVWFGAVSWDCLNNVYYTTRMANPGFRKEFGTSTVAGASFRQGSKSSLLISRYQSNMIQVMSSSSGTASIFSSSGILLEAFAVTAGSEQCTKRLLPGVYLVRYTAGCQTQTVILR
jgi:hypothetical protein